MAHYNYTEVAFPGKKDALPYTCSIDRLLFYVHLQLLTLKESLYNYIQQLYNTFKEYT